jgi:ribonuclease P protein subunit RPR2
VRRRAAGREVTDVTGGAETPGAAAAGTQEEELLAGVLVAAGGSTAFLYAAGREGPYELASTGRRPGDDGAALRAANRVLEERGPHLTGTIMALPLTSEGEVVGVLVVAFDSEPRDTFEVICKRVGPLLLLALLVDRERIRAELERHRDHAGAVQSQLEAYAVDLRATFRAERERALELARALDELAGTYRATVRGLAIAVEAKDEYTGGHLQRVARYGLAVTAVVAPEHLHDPQFEYGFLLHDVGKLTVPDAVLTKPGKLTPEEWAVMRQHPEAGRSILADIPFLAGAREIVYAHHERWDGQGYPRGLAGEEIPLGARIFPLADAFDAMTSDRPYRRALPFEVALEELRNGSGSQFWADAVDAFLGVDHEELLAVQREIPPTVREVA